MFADELLWQQMLAGWTFTATENFTSRKIAAELSMVVQLYCTVLLLQYASVL